MGHYTPTKRIGEVLELASLFFEKGNFVPRFGDLLIVASKQIQKRCLSYHRKNDLKFSLSFRTYKNSAPDIIWMDNITKENAILTLYPKTPVIYSSAKNRKNGTAIYVDSREQKAIFDGERKLLLVGDYTTPALLDKFHIERKSPEDLYGTLTKGHVRFRNEIIRAQVNNITLALYVECSKDKFVAKEFPGGGHRQLPGNVLGKIVDTVETRYGIEVVWCASREDMVKKMKSRFKFEEQRLNLPSKKTRGKAKKKR